jgi:hypothetical protein
MIKSTPLLLIAATTLSLTLTSFTNAQILIETFDGPNLPANWQVRSGSWAIVNQRATGTNLTNCVVEADVYWGGTAVQLGGVCARHGGTATEDCCMVKVQSNSSTVLGFDTLWSYERPGSAVAKTAITPLMTKTRIRLLIVGDTGWLQIDSTQDGIYDTVVGPKVYATHSGPGEVGVVCYFNGNAASIDNFALYNAVLMEDGASTPKIGTTYTMTLTTQATQLTPYVCAAALSNGGTNSGNLGGIPLGGGRFIPLALDPIFDLSLTAGSALGFVGTTDATGVGKPTLVIPNLASLVGVELHIAGVTAGGPSGIDNISNNHYVKIVQ